MQTLARKKKVSIRTIFKTYTTRLKISIVTFKNKKQTTKTIELPTFQQMKSGKFEVKQLDPDPLNNNFGEPHLNGT